jgi:hypothetical protein
MVKHVMLVLSAKVEHVVQNAVEQKENRQVVPYATLMVIVPPVVPGFSKATKNVPQTMVIRVHKIVIVPAIFVKEIFVVEVTMLPAVANV